MQSMSVSAVLVLVEMTRLLQSRSHRLTLCKVGVKQLALLYIIRALRHVETFVFILICN